MKRIFNNEWFRTILSTMIGIIAGLYLTNFYENRKLDQNKYQALAQVAIEIENNRDTLKIYQDTLSSLYEACEYVFPNIQIGAEELLLIIHKDSLDDFIRKSKRIFTYEEHEDYTQDSIRLMGELGLYLVGRLVVLDLTQVTWDAYKQANLLSITSFECLRNLEDVYALQRDVARLNQEWRDVFFRLEFMSSIAKRDAFLSLWKSLLMKQKFLLQFYEGFEKKELMENCG